MQLRRLAHPELECVLHLRQLSSEIYLDTKVQVPLVSRVLFHREDTVDLLSFLHCQVVINVEDCLLPVCVRRLGGCREPSPFVALGKLDIEERNKRLHVVVPSDLEMERS